MKSDVAPISSRGPRYWILLIVGTTISCIVTNILALVYQFGGFTLWRSLPMPSSTATHIVEADPDNVWIETSGGYIYSLTLYCHQNNTCRQWLVVKDSTEIEPMHFHENIRGTNCRSLSDSAFPGNPMLGKVAECILAPAYGVPDPESGYETYFALMTDGSLKYWQHGNSLLGFYFFLVVATLGGSLLGVFGISALYSARFRLRYNETAG